MSEKIKIKRSDLEKADQETLYKIALHLNNLKQAEQTRRLEFYKERMHRGQVEFHNSHHRWRFLSGGNRIGKSTAGMIEFIWLNTGTHPHRKSPVPIKSAIVLQDFENHCKNIIEPKLNQWAPKNTIAKIERHQQGALKRINWTCGSTTDVYSHDQDLKVFEGSDYDVVWCDEPPPQKIHNAMWRGLTDRGGILYITGTPITEAWLFPLYKRGLEVEDALYWSITVPTWWNAKNIGDGDEELGRKRIQEFADMYDADERATRIDGEFKQLRGLVFKTFKRSTHMIAQFPWPHTWNIIESIDLHPRKPWGVVWLGLAENGTKILLKCAKIEGTLDEVAKEILFLRENLGIEGDRRARIIRTLIDNYANAPIMTKSHTDPQAKTISMRQELENYIGPRGGGPRVEVAKKGANSVGHKIDLFKRWLAFQQRDDGRKTADFYVFDNADNELFLDDIENYVWDSYRGRVKEGYKDTPKKINDDILDPILQIALTMYDNNLIESQKPFSMLRGGWDTGVGGTSKILSTGR